MVDPPMPATVGALNGFARLIDSASAEGDGLLLLRRLVEQAAAVSGADGACFLTISGHTSLVIAACGTMAGLANQPELVQPRSVGARWGASGELGVLDPSDLGAGFRELLAGPKEGYRLLGVPAGDGVVPIGLLVLQIFTDRPPLLEPAEAMLKVLASYAASLYRTGRDRRVPATATEPAGWTAQPGSTLGPARAGRTLETAEAGRTLETAEAGRRGDDRDLFIAVTSHELRTPVTVIRGYADTLLEHWDNLDELEKRRAVRVIAQRSLDLAQLLDRLLTAAGDGAAVPHQVAGLPFDLPEAVREATEDLPGDLRRNVRLNLPARLPRACGDRGSIAMIVTELVTNSYKYSPDLIDVELTAGADRRAVWIKVADRGVGIRPEHVDRAFERFWQLGDHDRCRRSGVGLGLYLVRRIVERQRGWVSLDAREGGGTVVEVRLPRAGEGPGEA